jgi:undecaprenyl-diphosphatase
MSAETTSASWTDWRRRPDVVIPAALLGVFLILLALVMARPTVLTHLDGWIRDRVQSVAHSEHLPNDNRPDWPLIKHVADLGGTLPAMAVTAVVAVAAALLRRSWRPLLAAAVAYAVLGGAVLTLKANVKRPGPGQLTMVHGGLGYFPSGHTANTLMCYGTCALLLAGGRTGVLVGRKARTAIGVGMGIVALGVAVSLVWLDYHWVSDVLGSYALCGAALFGVAAVLGFHAPGRRTASAPSPPPAAS